MPAFAPLRAESRNFAPLWPLLCSAVLVGVMLASETVREYRAQGNVARRRETGAFGAACSTDEPRLAQYERAHQPGRGRHAETPWQIPWKGWRDILWRTYEQIGEDRLLAVAAGVVFYGLLAVFPAVTAFVSWKGAIALLMPICFCAKLASAARSYQKRGVSGSWPSLLTICRRCAFVVRRICVLILRA